MVSALTHNRVFSAPLRAQAFRLRSLAYGAITLLPILSIKRMSELTVRLPRVHRADTATIKRVLSRTNRSEVVGAHTVSSSTDVIYDETRSNVSNMDIIRDAMSASAKSPEKEGAVSVLIKRAFPNMALTFFNPLTIEPIQFRLSTSHMPLLPLMPLAYHI